jgi:O-antigen ligase
MAGAAWVWRRPFESRPSGLLMNRITYAILIMMGVLVASSLQSISYLLANKVFLLRFIQFFLYTGFFIVLVQLDFSAGQTRRLLILVLAAGVVEGVIGAGQWVRSGQIYISGTFDYSHNSFAVYILFIIILMTGVLLESRRVSVRLGCAASLIALLYPFLFTFSRVGYIALAVSVVLLLLMPLRRSSKLALLTVICAFVVITVTLLPVDVIKRAQTILPNLTGEQVGISYGARLKMWGHSLADFIDSPILGKGTWHYALRDNFFMKLLGEAGILGLAAFLWLLYTILKAEWRIVMCRFENDLLRGIAVGLLPASVACLVVVNLSGDFFLLHRFMGTFWIVLALMLRYAADYGRTKHISAP